MLKTLTKANIKGKRVLLRVGYDITLSYESDNWIVTDDQRIKATVPTIDYLLEQGCSIVIIGGWIGRPKAGIREDKYKMDAVAKRLSQILNKEVRKLDETVGVQVESAVFSMKAGDIILLENTRFNPGETEANRELAEQIARLGEFVVFDAFAQSMRVHASTTGILENHKNRCCAGFLMEQELKVLGQILKSPIEPFVVILGGAKVSDKVALLQNILDKASMILIGGALANPFFKAKGLDIGGSVSESVFIDEAKGEKYDAVQIANSILEKTRGLNVPHELIPSVWPNSHNTTLTKIQLPLDIIVAKKKEDEGFDDETVIIKKINSLHKLCDANEAILDIGPLTTFIYSEILKRARTIFWNGPMGFFEDFNFSKGTKDVAEAIANSKGFSIIGGGDTEGVVSRFHLEGRFGHVSTGGGASLTLLSGETFPVMKYLEE